MPDVDLKPGSPEWLRTVTASKIPVILGVSRYKSQYTLWHEMAGLLEPEPISQQTQELFDYGHAAEVAAAEFWKWRNPGWRLSQREVQYSRDDLPFPNAATLDRRASRGRSRKAVEVKTAESLEEWGDDGSGEMPADYAAQVIWQQYLSGFTDPADLVLWPTFGRPRIYTVEFSEVRAEAIVAKASAWTASLAAGTPPPLDTTISCYETVRRLHPDIERDREVEISPDLAARYLTANADRKVIDVEERGTKTEVLSEMGQAQYATCQGYRIADRRNAKGGTVALYANTKTDFLEGIPA
ncbi:YqaJ viral recombinase family protein [Rhodococcus sp. UNC363MFTsu5.1]|uniref:YqaJ viral recombinase family protein n=1 Tax=Rhodococcus sp. UNC363MFTsu5.1 TaxID=1449069 RepID=UPI0004815C4D|nr:YqaJ viral recombinase family protein [Rhodococcus sp. UNC363MFTsu5.1]